MLTAEIKVNGTEVASIEAHRIGPGHGDDERVYLCEVSGRGVKGYPYRHKFVLVRESGGEATELIADILKASNKRLSSNVQA